MANVKGQQAQGGRSGARAAATGAGQASGSGRQPAPRDEATGTDASDQTNAEAPAAPVPLIVIMPNAKRKGTLAEKHYGFYGPALTMSTVGECRERGVRGKDLSWDRDRGHILVGDQATNFPLKGTKEQQVEYLRGIDKNVFNDKFLIKAGLMEAPKVEETAKADATAS